MIKLKPQFTLRVTPGGKPCLTSESYHLEIDPARVPLLRKLVDGIDPELISDHDMAELISLNSQGFLSIIDHPDAPIWELSPGSFQTVHEQFSHVTFRIVDKTYNKVGDSVREHLLSSGLKEAENAQLVLALVDSALDLPDVEGNMLPLVCNRSRITVGPMCFPWRKNFRELIKYSETYLPTVNYKLPAVFDSLQRAWLSVAVLQFVGLNRLRYVSNCVEYNMTKQEFKIWPVKY
jgi:hypothetical protein